MAGYLHGNLAVEDRDDYRIKSKEIKRTVYRAKAIPVKEKLLYLLTIIVCVLIAGVILWRNATIYEMNTQIQQMEQTIQTLQGESSGLQQEVRKLENPQRLKNEAQKLGLGPATDEQISRMMPEMNASQNPLEVALNQ